MHAPSLSYVGKKSVFLNNIFLQQRPCRKHRYPHSPWGHRNLYTIVPSSWRLKPGRWLLKCVHVISIMEILKAVCWTTKTQSLCFNLNMKTSHLVEMTDRSHLGVETTHIYNIETAKSESPSLAHNIIQQIIMVCPRSEADTTELSSA